MNSAVQERPSGADTSFSEEQMALLEQAAQIEGCSVESFVHTHAREAAEETIRRSHTIVLNREDSEKFAEALLAAPRPASPRMKEALALYRATVREC